MRVHDLLGICICGQAKVNLELYKNCREMNLSYLFSLLLWFNVKIPLGLYFCHIICNSFCKISFSCMRKKNRTKKIWSLTSISCFISNKQNLNYHLFLIAENKKNSLIYSTQFHVPALKFWNCVRMSNENLKFFWKKIKHCN